MKEKETLCRKSVLVLYFYWDILQWKFYVVLFKISTNCHIDKNRKRTKKGTLVHKGVGVSSSVRTACPRPDRFLYTRHISVSAPALAVAGDDGMGSGGG